MQEARKGENSQVLTRFQMHEFRWREAEKVNRVQQLEDVQWQELHGQLPAVMTSYLIIVSLPEMVMFNKAYNKCFFILRFKNYYFII